MKKLALLVALAAGLLAAAVVQAQSVGGYGYGYTIWGPRLEPSRGGDAGPAPDSGVPIIQAVLLTGSSYGHEGGGTLQTPPILTDAGVSDGSVNTWQVIDAGVVEAVERAGVAGAIQAFRVAAAATGEQWVLIDYQTPGVGLDSLAADPSPLLANISAAAAWADAQGAEICPIGYFDISWNYYAEAGALPFSGVGSFAESVATVKSAAETRLASLVGSGVASGCTSLVFHDLIGAHPGTPSTALVRWPYAAEYYATYTNAPMFSTFHLATQAPPDGTHFTSAGAVAFGEALGRAFLWARNDGAASRFVPTGVTIVDGQTVEVAYTAPCRTHNDCAANPPLVVDTTGQAAQVTQGGAATLGLHFLNGGSLVSPPAVSVATPLACDLPATSCTVRYTFASGLPSFTEVQVGQVGCHNSGDTDCFSGPTAAKSGGNNVRMQVTSACASPPCSVAPAAGSFSVSYDAGVSVDAGFVAANLQGVQSTTGNYYTASTTGSETSMCWGAWGTIPQATGDTVVRPVTNQRGFLGQSGGTPGCLISGSGGGTGTGRLASGSYSASQRIHLLCCYPGGGAGASSINVYVDGVLANGTTFGTATAMDGVTATNFPDNALTGTTDVDEVVFFRGKGSITAGELDQVGCTTKAATDSWPNSCTGVTTDRYALCVLGSPTQWYQFESGAETTDTCGTLGLSVTGSPTAVVY